MEKNNYRNEKIDILRGIAIILVIIGHGIDLLGQKDVISPIWGGIYEGIYTFHMPLFFIISGYIYKNNNEKWTNIVIRNVITFYIPYLFFSYLYWTERIIASEVFGVQLTRSDYAGGISLLWHAVGQTWFLLSMMFVKTVFNILDTYTSDTFAFIMFTLLFWLFYIFPQYKILYYLHWGFFFCLGYIINRQYIEIKKKSIIYIGCINILLIGIDRYILCGTDKFVQVFIGVSIFVMYMCIKRIPNVRLLVLCGKNSMVIFMIHGLTQYFCFYILFDIMHIKVHYILLGFMIILQLLISFLIVELFTRVKYLHWLQIIFYPYQYIVRRHIVGGANRTFIR